MFLFFLSGIPFNLIISSPIDAHLSCFQSLPVTNHGYQELGKCLRAQPCLNLYGPMDCSLSGSSVHGIFQARLLDWVAISYSRDHSQPTDRIPVSCISCIGKWIVYHQRHLGSLSLIVLLSIYNVYIISVHIFSFLLGKCNTG